MITVALLGSLGIEGLKEGRKEITGKCPMHEKIVGRRDRHASWSINKESGAHLCFSCGYKGGIITLYNDLTGSVPDDIQTQMAVANFRAAMEEYDDEVIEPWEWDPDQLVPVPEKLLKLRNLTSESAEFYGVKWDRERKMWVLPFTRPNGDVFGAQYRQKGNEINQPDGVDTKSSLFGIDKVKGESTVAVVESPLDCLRFRQIGVAAVATFGAFVSDDQVKMLNRYFTLVCMAMDDDDAGKRSAEAASQRLRRLGCPVINFDYTGLGVKDPGDLESDHELREAWQKTFALCTP